MKPLLKTFLVCMVIGSGMQGIRAQQVPEQGRKTLRHVVLFSFKEGTTEAKIDEIRQAFAGLPSKIPQIAGFEWGLNNSPEGLNKGFTHCYLLTFRSEEDRAIYLPHPDHKAFGDLAGPHIADVLVVDYWADAR